MTKYSYIIFAAFALLALASCRQSEDGPEGVAERFRIKAYISDSGFAGGSGFSRAKDPEDGFSVKSFEPGDKAGFFSEGGDRNNANGEFENSPMTFSGGYFVGGESMSVDINRLGRTLLYFPYSDGVNGRQNVRYGDVTSEVKDVLVSLTVGNPESAGNALVASFTHLFSMLVIDGGYGFEKFHESDDVSVTLSWPVETFEFCRVDDPGSEVGYWVMLNGGYAYGTKPDDSYATVKGHYDKDKGKYYVIVPTDGSIKVSSINVKDDSGREHKIRWNKLVEMGCRYPLTLELDELVPTIYLHDITPWGKNDLEANAAKGIGDESDLVNWFKAYNKSDSDERENALLQYGDKVEVKNAQGVKVKEYWRFYLTGNIDMSGVQGYDAGHLVNKLEDEFDGCGYAITGLSLKGENAALFNVIEGEYACVKNLVVDKLVVDATAEGAAVGALVTDLKSGVVANCSFTDLSMHALKSSVGVLAGTITGNEGDIKVENCKFSGAIFGKSSTESHVAGRGSVPEAVRKGCDVSNVMFGAI